MQSGGNATSLSYGKTRLLGLYELDLVPSSIEESVGQPQVEQHLGFFLPLAGGPSKEMLQLPRFSSRWAIADYDPSRAADWVRALAGRVGNRIAKVVGKIC